MPSKPDHGRFPAAWRMAVSSRLMLASSIPVTVSPRPAGVSAARLAASRRMRRSPPEQGSSPACSAVMAPSQSTAAMGVLQVVPCWMNRLVKSSRCRKVSLLISRATPASTGQKPAAQARSAAARSLTSTRVSGGCQGGGGDVAVGGHAKADGFGPAGGGQVALGELVVGGGEADLESLGFTGPAFALGFGDAGQEVVADFFEAVPLGGVDSE